jgi:hypothetical protein
MQVYLTESAQIMSTNLNAVFCELTGILTDVKKLMVGFLKVMLLGSFVG